MTDAAIAFIGGGNMARSLIGGLIADGYDPERLCVSDPDAEQRARLGAEFRIRTVSDNRAAAAARLSLTVRMRNSAPRRARCSASGSETHSLSGS